MRLAQKEMRNNFYFTLLNLKNYFILLHNIFFILVVRFDFLWSPLQQYYM